ncbi:hypothetical protein QJQ45_003524 [Haematococcus lacustris]|nr:hypothetical protein QJQ45_003524 [Haematococcus lacustris]
MAATDWPAHRAVLCDRQARLQLSRAELRRPERSETCIRVANVCRERLRGKTLKVPTFCHAAQLSIGSEEQAYGDRLVRDPVQCSDAPTSTQRQKRSIALICALKYVCCCGDVLGDVQATEQRLQVVLEEHEREKQDWQQQQQDWQQQHQDWQQQQRHSPHGPDCVAQELEATGIITTPLEQLLSRYFRPVHITNAASETALKPLNDDKVLRMKEEGVSGRIKMTVEDTNSWLSDYLSDDALGGAASPADALGGAASPADALGGAASPADALGGAASPADALGGAASPAGALGAAASPASALGAAASPPGAQGGAASHAGALGGAASPAGALRAAASHAGALGAAASPAGALGAAASPPGAQGGAASPADAQGGAVSKPLHTAKQASQARKVLRAMQRITLPVKLPTREEYSSAASARDQNTARQQRQADITNKLQHLEDTARHVYNSQQPHLPALPQKGITLNHLKQLCVRLNLATKERNWSMWGHTYHNALRNNFSVEAAKREVYLKANVPTTDSDDDTPAVQDTLIDIMN